MELTGRVKTEEKKMFSETLTFLSSTMIGFESNLIIREATFFLNNSITIVLQLRAIEKNGKRIITCRGGLI